jgi:hypothetical protein
VTTSTYTSTSTATLSRPKFRGGREKLQVSISDFEPFDEDDEISIEELSNELKTAPVLAAKSVINLFSTSGLGDEVDTEVGIQLYEEDILQFRDIDDIMAERSKRFYDPKAGMGREMCVVVAVQAKNQENRHITAEDLEFSFTESLSELCELCGTAGLAVVISR